jgi:hypothetical protein
MKTKNEAHMTLDLLHRDVGVFQPIVLDNVPELVGGEIWRKAIHAGSQIKPAEAYTHKQNLAESGICKLHRMYRRAMLATNSPHIRWDYCLTLMADICYYTALDLPDLDGDSPQTKLSVRESGEAETR